MTLDNDYTSKAMRTNNGDAGTYGTDNELIHAALGLSDETCEILTAMEDYKNAPNDKTHAALVGEVGDAFWFLTLCCQAKPILARLEEFYDSTENYRHSRLLMHTSLESALIHATKNLVGYVKKGYAFGVDLDPGTMEANMLVYFGCLVDICHDIGIEPEIAQQANVKKLAARFPRAFREEDAVNRDSSAEAAAVNKEIGDGWGLMGQEPNDG